MKTTRHFPICLRSLGLGLGLAICLSMGTAAAADSVVIGVSEPSETIDLSFPEAGVISLIEVEEGSRVSAGDILATLDSRVLEARLKMAKISASSDAAIKSAKADLTVRARRLTELERLAQRGSANDEELARARADQAIAEADLQSAEEASAGSRLLVEQIEIEIEQRKLRSSIDGVVTRLYRDAAESVSSGNGPVATVVALDTLHLVTFLDLASSSALKDGDVVAVEAIDTPGVSDTATVVFVSPVTDSSSSTVRVKLELENADRRHRSGVKYRIQLNAVDQAASERVSVTEL